MRHPLLESCEDVWLDLSGRKLYAACANPITRVAWSPGGNSYDLQGRAAGGGRIDHITVLDIDQPGADGLYSVRALNFRDNEGNIFAATIPDHHQFIRAFHDPYGTNSPSTVMMIRKMSTVSVKEAIQEALLISSATPAGYLPKRIPAKLWRSWIMHNTGAPGSSTSVFFRGVWMRKMSDAATRARFMAVSYKQLAAPREACL
jgi:hypothetical protein